MDVVICSNNKHFFDKDKYEKCPHCGAAPKNDEGIKSAPLNETVQYPETEANIETRGQAIIRDFVSEEKVDYAVVEEKEEKGSLAEEVKKVLNGNDDRTFGVFYKGKRKATGEEPVVGWLICVEGKHFGESFNLSTGRNSIGRKETNHVVISEDPHISREKHAWITYEPKKRQFFIQPGESSGLSYLNNENVMESQKLCAYDELEFGESKFIFFPLCGEKFTWETYINKE